MHFCSNCGARLDDIKPECPNCMNISLAETESRSATSDGEVVTSRGRTSGTLKDQKESIDHLFSSTARLVVIKGGTPGREFPIDYNVCNIGRWDPNLQSHPEIDLSDEDIDAKVSRVHARINLRAEGYYIEDMGSRNGTFLNREFRLIQGVEYSLKPGDEIIIGHIFFRFTLVN